MVVGIVGGAAMVATGGTAGFVAAVAVHGGVVPIVLASIGAGPVGWLCMGAEESALLDMHYTLDCWKAVLHDQSTEPSKGMFLRDVAKDLRIKTILVDRVEEPWTKLDHVMQKAEIILENVWNEKFLVEYVTMPSNQVLLHAKFLQV